MQQAGRLGIALSLSLLPLLPADARRCGVALGANPLRYDPTIIESIRVLLP